MKIPKHVGIVLDGNRRYAKQQMLQPWKGHYSGAETFKQFTKWCFELGITEITAYGFSLQNFNRPREEINHLMNIMKKEFQELLTPEKQEELRKNNINWNIIGKLEKLPSDVQRLAKQLMKATKNNKGKRINLAIAYGGREEIVEAVKKIAKKTRKSTLKIDENTITEHLWLSSEPDLVIRTGGEQRTSNFLPWQSTYSELMFLDKYWPELKKEDLIACIKEYSERERRYGK